MNGHADEVFAALADPTRLRLLDVLAAHREATATTLTADAWAWAVVGAAGIHCG